MLQVPASSGGEASEPRSDLGTEENAKEHYVVAGMEQSTGGGQSSQDVFAVSEVPWVFLTIIPIYFEGHVC